MKGEGQKAGWLETPSGGLEEGGKWGYGVKFTVKITLRSLSRPPGGRLSPAFSSVWASEATKSTLTDHRCYSGRSA